MVQILKIWKMRLISKIYKIIILKKKWKDNTKKRRQMMNRFSDLKWVSERGASYKDKLATTMNSHTTTVVLRQ